MSRWRAVVRRELHQYQRPTGADVIERQDLLDHSLPVLEAEFPDAKSLNQGSSPWAGLVELASLVPSPSCYHRRCLCVYLP